MYLQRPPSRPEPAPDPVPLAIRAATLGVIAAVLLGVLLFRLWALQVLHSDQYVGGGGRRTACARSTMPSPRGEILDRNGNVLVSNTASDRRPGRRRPASRRHDCGATIATRTSSREPGRAAGC